MRSKLVSPCGDERVITKKLVKHRSVNLLLWSRRRGGGIVYLQRGFFFLSVCILQSFVTSQAACAGAYLQSVILVIQKTTSSNSTFHLLVSVCLVLTHLWASPSSYHLHGYWLGILILRCFSVGVSLHLSW